MVRREEARLAERLFARDESALREAIDTYGSMVHGIARRVIGEPSLAEEVVQDTFLALWRRPGAFDPERGSLLGFLLAVARNKAIDLVRREESRRRSAEALIAESEASSRGDGDAESNRLEEQSEVKEALAKLSSVQREAIFLAYFGGRTYREVAVELGIPEGTAKTRLRDGLMKLRELMSTSRGSV